MWIRTNAPLQEVKELPVEWSKRQKTRHVTNAKRKVEEVRESLSDIGEKLLLKLAEQSNPTDTSSQSASRKPKLDSEI